MSKKISYYTKEGLDKLTSELNTLKTKGRADIARQIAEARDKGDLSENAEYDAAKDAQGHLEAKIAKLEDLVGNARLIDETKIDTSAVSILSKVTIKNKKNGAISNGFTPRACSAAGKVYSLNCTRQVGHQASTVLLLLWASLSIVDSPKRPLVSRSPVRIWPMPQQWVGPPSTR